MLIAKVSVEKTSIRFDKLFDYSVPEEMTQLQIGCRVSVPFGRGNQLRQGIVLDIYQKEESASLKPVMELLDQTPVLSTEMLDIVKFLVSTTFCTYYEAVRAILPSGLNYKLEEAYRVRDHLDSLPKDQFSDLQLEIISYLRKAKSNVEIQRIIKARIEQNQKDEIDGLIDKGILIPVSSSKRKIGDKTINMVRLTSSLDQDLDNHKMSKKQRQVVDFLSSVGTAAIREVCYFCGVTDIVIRNLEKYGLIERYEKETYRNPYQSSAIPLQTIQLTEEQKQVFEEIWHQYQTDLPSVALLHGVTGSGKTQVFLKLMQRMLSIGKQTIFMVPEISLTPQMIQKFQTVFGGLIAVMHSSLSMGEQLDEYKRIQRGEAKIVIGTRSAVFAPFRDLGMIVMDEEGEPTYKSSDMAPRYHAREVAKFRCVHHNALLLLASATPSVDSYYHAQKGDYHLYQLTQRYADASLPEVAIIDMAHEPSSMVNGISEYLAEEINSNLERHEQSILLLNRRGYQSVQTCVDCGWVEECPHCSVNLTYHRANGFCMCHYCGYSKEKSVVCPKCGGQHLILLGCGTQKIEEELHKLYPNSNILRMDADTTFTRAALEKKIADFSDGKYDILVGTQIVAKGLNFPNVTLVGVLTADNLLFGNDFKVHESAFSLLTQVVGRSGRGKKLGRAYIQTYHPDHPVIRQAASQDYASFYHSEIIERNALNYPPYCDLCLIGITGSREREVDAATSWLVKCLSTLISQEKVSVQLLGRSKPSIYKMNNKYRQRIILKCKNNMQFRRFMRKVLVFAANQKLFSNVHLYADINGEIN